MSKKHQERMNLEQWASFQVQDQAEVMRRLKDIVGDNVTIIPFARVFSESLEFLRFQYISHALDRLETFEWTKGYTQALREIAGLLNQLTKESEKKNA